MRKREEIVQDGAGGGVERESCEKRKQVLSPLSHPLGSSPTIWTLYLVSREEVKQSTEARSTWKRANWRVGAGGPQQGRDGTQCERPVTRDSGLRSPATEGAGVCLGRVPDS